MIKPQMTAMIILTIKCQTSLVQSATAHVSIITPVYFGDIIILFILINVNIKYKIGFLKHFYMHKVALYHDFVLSA